MKHVVAYFTLLNILLCFWLNNILVNILIKCHIGVYIKTYMKNSFLDDAGQT